MIRRVPGAIRARSVMAEKRQVRVTINTEMAGRDDVIVVSAGVELASFKANPVVLFNHNPDWPIARALTIEVTGTDLVSLVQFPPEGGSPRADEVFALISAGVINAASTGFDIIEGEPIDASNPGGGMRIKRCDLAEFSFVAVPALPSALITERAHRPADPARAARQATAARYVAELEAERRRVAIDPDKIDRQAKAARYRRELARPAR